MWAVCTKTLRDKRWMMLGWFAGIVAITVFTVSFFPSFKDNNGFDEVLKSLPVQFKGILGDALAFKQLPNFVAQQVLDLRAPLMIIIVAVVLGVNITVAEEEAGTLKTLQTLPVSRTAVVCGKWLAAGVVLAVIAGAVIPGVWLGTVIVNDGIALDKVAFASLLLWLLAFSITSVTMLIGFMTGRRALTVTLASLFAAYNVFLAMFAPAVDWLEGVFKFTFYYYYNNPALITAPVEWLHVAVLGGGSLVCLAVMLALYHRRNIDAA